MEDERHRQRSRRGPHPSSHLPWALEARAHPTSPESPQCWDPWSWLQRTGQGDQVQRLAACSGHDLGFQEEPLSVLTQTGGEQRPCVCAGGAPKLERLLQWAQAPAEWHRDKAGVGSTQASCLCPTRSSPVLALSPSPSPPWLLSPAPSASCHLRPLLSHQPFQTSSKGLWRPHPRLGAS